MEYVDETTNSMTSDALKEVLNNVHIESVHYWTKPQSYKTKSGEELKIYESVTLHSDGVTICSREYLCEIQDDGEYDDLDIYACVWLDTAKGCVYVRNPVTKETIHQPVNLRSIRMIDAYWRTTQKEIDEHYKNPFISCVGMLVETMVRDIKQRR